MKPIYHFLGGIKFAIFLITSVTIFVIAGTLIESRTESHAFAANLTYNSFWFSFFIWGFFINILFSATRRWPFKKKHIPFLITHFGLLMILSGVMIKNYFGTQGVMTLIEGSGSEEIALANTKIIHIEDKKKTKQFDLTDQEIKIVDYYPHSKETLQAWIIEGVGKIYGLKSFPVNDGFTDELKSIHETLHPNYPDFEIIGVKIGEDTSLLEVAKELYLKGLDIVIKDRKKEEILYQESLQAALETPPNWLGVKLDFDFSYLSGFSKSSLTTKIQAQEIKIPLFGENCLRNLNLSTPYLGSSPYIVSLRRKPLILFIQDKEEDIFIFIYDQDGRLFSEKFLLGQLNSILAYDKGFQGYSVQFKYPLNPLSLEEMEKKSLMTLKKQLEAIDLSLIPDHELKATYWISTLLPEMIRKIEEGHDFLHLLEIADWPLINDLKNIKIQQDQHLLSEQLDTFVGQIYALAEHLPLPDFVEPDKFLSSYLRLYSLQLNKMLPDEPDETEMITFESPLIAKREKQTPHKKLESNQPLIGLKLNHEIIFLSFDGKGNGLKWPTVDGKYLLRFQPRFKSIPYRLRLRNARQIHYPNSPSSYSFEADLLITDKKSNKTSEITISMNEVHETLDGYRFYLSHISPGNETDIQQVQLVVNHDPAKYYITYPGAMILTLGIFLLFWRKKH